MSAELDPDEQKRRHAAASRKGRYAQRSAAKRLKKVLSAPERRAQERAFSEVHGNDTDEALYAYVKDQKRLLGNRMKPSNTIGYTYLVQRLGEWRFFMGKINKEIQREKNVVNHGAEKSQANKSLIL